MPDGSRLRYERLVITAEVPRVGTIKVPGGAGWRVRAVDERGTAVLHNQREHAVALPASTAFDVWCVSAWLFACCPRCCRLSPAQQRVGPGRIGNHCGGPPMLT